MAEGSTIKMDLKIHVDTKTKKVVFAEAGKDFVDFIFNIPFMPLSTVSKVLSNTTAKLGCIGDLYQSMDSLDRRCFETDRQMYQVMRTRSPVIIPLLSVREVSDYRSVYICVKHQCITDYPGEHCRGCDYGSTMCQSGFSYCIPVDKKAGYVKDGASYIIMDNLEVKPMSISLIKSLFKDFDSLDERQVQVGYQEGLAILKSVFGESSCAKYRLSSEQRLVDLIIFLEGQVILL